MLSKMEWVIGRIIILAIILITITGCQKDDNKELIEMPAYRSNTQQLDMPINPSLEEIGELPPATVQKLSFTSTRSFSREIEIIDPLSPDAFTETMFPGQHAEEKKTAIIPPIPPKADILFSFDLTGSMGGELNNVKTNCENIANAIMAAAPESKTGAISHMDYPSSYAACGYSNTYGAPGDYAYRLDHAFSSDPAPVHAAIAGLTLGHGWDHPESYARVFWESYNDPLLQWRPEATKFVVAFLDAVPHDCNLPSGVTTGPDPGPDGNVGTLDDLVMDNVLTGMANNGIHLVVVFSGGTGDFNNVWKKYAENSAYKVTVFKIDPDGTIPGGTNIDEFIINIIEASAPKVNEIKLILSDPATYGPWVQISPPSFSPVEFEKEYYFLAEFTVPTFAPPDIYNFEIILVGDDTEYDRQDVTITVEDFPVPLDIKPGSCPNPLNSKSGGVIPVAILGSRDLNVNDINPATVYLALPDGNVPPLRWENEDVGKPYLPLLDKEGAYDCHEEGPDGFLDLTFKFDKKDVVSKLGPLEKGDILSIRINGLFDSGILFVGEDVMIVVK